MFIIECSENKQTWQRFDNANSEEAAMILTGYYAGSNPRVLFRYRPSYTLRNDHITTCMRKQWAQTF